jgi:integrase/recombinase XerD
MATAHRTLISIPAETQSVLDRFANYLYARSGFARGTVDLTIGFVRRAVPRMGLDPSHEAIEGYIADMHRAGESFGQISNAIKAVERFAEFLGRPIRLARPRKPQGISIAALSEAKVAIMIARTKSLREKALLSLLAYSGIRNNELCELRVRDIDMAQQSVVIECGKNSKGRMCCVSGECIEILGDYLRERQGRPDQFLFVTIRHGHQLQTQDVRKFIRVLARRAGIPGRVWPHLFRHSLATALLNRGASVYSIQALLGHTFVSTTMSYYLHPSAKNIRADYYRCAPSYI